MTRLSASFIAAAVVGALIDGLVPSSLAFDTGPHNDIMRNVMERFGYTPEAQALGAIGNWFTDVYAFSFSFGNHVPFLPNHIADLEMLHCNNLYSIVYGANYIAQHTISSRKAIQDAVRRNDTLSYLALLGTTAHAYQDFYAHSNWAELHLRNDCDCYNVHDTFFSDIIAANGSVDAMINSRPQLSGWQTYSWQDRNYPNFNIFGGNVEHGEYCTGTNKDSYVRPYFEETHAYAFSATVEWIYNVEQWANAVDPNFVKTARAWVPPTEQDRQDLFKNFEHAFEVSYSTTAWVFGGDDGHWKGYGSGSVRTFAASVTNFAKTNTTYTNLYLRKDPKPVWSLVTETPPYAFLNNSYDPSGEIIGNVALIQDAIQGFTPFPSIPAEYTNMTVVVVRTLMYNVSTSLGNKNPWALIEIDNFAIREAPMMGQRVGTPYWTAIKYIPSPAINAASRNVSIKYTLIGAGDSSSVNTRIPIANSQDGTLYMTFNSADNSLVGTGISPGVYNSTLQTLKSAQQDSSIEIYVDTRGLTCTNSTGQNGHYVTFCANTAFGELGTVEGCPGSKFSKNSKNGGVTIRAGKSLWIVLCGILVAVLM
ncbi:uncharacterized protein SPPG_01734 [Spizellomyces punctatus DAOM BR117]|uniref:Phospholipase C/D domain-containing protein n=1 Tax=Spizellomyces punctatus (strain DAOM BR117) TaxID=645134 RepID=A0A0L0HNJ6_SPIPD|nr:uncharacterized protein SPPG_01734 [Spizellomyces punctatus DAOM BR117]KND02647.1 hypothetical protein SPPG_01734 [Spizellomyces punctatus DAOM BR117]|eukprot:XP_016610686.1 hypothetical protein SPPG_01734 [Spizellomyces punctatus DAOM BR117]